MTIDDGTLRRNLVGILFVCECIVAIVCLISAAVAIGMVSEHWCGWVFIALAAMIIWVVIHKSIRQIAGEAKDDGSS